MVKLNSLGKLNKAFHNFDILGLYYNIANHQNKNWVAFNVLGSNNKQQ